MVAATPVSVERAFAHHGVLVSRVSSAPELCDRLACTGLDVWGGSDKPVYLAPVKGKDFMVVIFLTAAEARRMAMQGGPTRSRPLSSPASCRDVGGCTGAEAVPEGVRQ